MGLSMPATQGMGLLTTDLTPVAMNMEIAIQSHDPDSLFLAWGWHDWLLAHRTSGGKFPENGEIVC